MADLFQTTKQNVGQHIGNILAEGELAEISVVKEFFTAAADARKYLTRFYNVAASGTTARIVPLSVAG